jgi:hypothetical protein
MVARRLIPLVVAFAMAFAPVALEACQASCLSQATEAMASASAHHHHSHAAAPNTTMPAGHVHHGAGTPAPGAGVVLAAQPHPCDQGDDLPAFSAPAQDILVTPALVRSTFYFPEPEERPVPVAAPDARASSARLALATHLRL